MERRISIFRNRQREQRRKQWHGFLNGKSVLAQHLFELLQLLVRSILSVELQQALEQIGHRKQYRVLRVLRTPTFPAGMWFTGNSIFQDLHQTGFANATFTSQEHDLPLP